MAQFDPFKEAVKGTIRMMTPIFSYLTFKALVDVFNKNKKNTSTKKKRSFH